MNQIKSNENMHIWKCLKIEKIQLNSISKCLKNEKIKWKNSTEFDWMKFENLKNWNLKIWKIEIWKFENVWKIQLNWMNSFEFEIEFRLKTPTIAS